MQSSFSLFIKKHRLFLAFFPLLAVYATIAGCTHLHTLTPESPEDFYDRINSKVNGRPAIIHLEGGDERRGASVHVSKDSVTWLVPDVWTRQFTEPRGVPLSEVREITVKNRVKGGFIGFGLGVLAGGAFGIIPAMLNQRGMGKSTTRVLGIGSIFALVGGAGLAWAGSRRGVIDTFVFSETVEGTPEYMLAEQLQQSPPGIVSMVRRLRSSIRNIDSNEISETITESNIVYTKNNKQFCYLIARNRDIQVFLPFKPGTVSDPMGLLRPWSSGDSWFSLVLGGDIDYAVSLIQQAYRNTE